MGATKELLDKGIGPFGSVCEFHMGLFETDSTAIHDIQSIRTCLNSLLATDGGDRTATALCCAFLNRYYRQSSELFMVDADGKLRTVWESNSITRDITADSLGL